MKKTREQIRFNMQRVRNKNSLIEQMLRRELWERGLRYRKNVNSIFGKPDIAFIGKKIAIFVDSEFWHGYDWKNKQREIKSNKKFWIKKIEGNIRRDKEVSATLATQGWVVLRFWGRDIKKSLTKCADQIENAFSNR
ncbi:MAG: very short patch repair endonuclease [Elusimicrobiaceae bacterium]|nr:very short patch repair endonuclease [Elusimicrobiaceae bacterium]